MNNLTNATSENFLKKNWKRDFEGRKIAAVTDNGLRGAVAGLPGPVYHPYEHIAGNKHPIYVFEREQGSYAEMVEWVGRTNLKNIVTVHGDIYDALFKVRLVGRGRGKGAPNKIVFLDVDGCKTFKSDGAKKHEFYMKLAHSNVMANTSIIFDEMAQRRGSNEKEFHTEGMRNIFECAGWDVTDISWVKSNSYPIRGAMHFALIMIERGSHD
jgi:hypothetical protein